MRPQIFVALLLTLCLGFEWPGRLPRLIYELGHAEPAQRREAVRRLKHYAADAVREPLLEALEDADPEVRLEAAVAVGELRLHEAAAALASWLTDKDEAVVTTALQALGQIAEPTTRTALVRLLVDPRAEVRKAAIWAVHDLGGADTEQALLGSLEDSEPSVRLAAAMALYGIADARALAALTAHARDADAEVRAAALTALGGLHDARALPPLLRAIDDPAELVHLAALMALGDLGDAGAVVALRAQLAAGPRMAKVALAALGRIDDPRAQAVLIDQLGDSEWSGTAADALVERVRRSGDTPSDDPKHPSVVQALASLLASERAPAQIAAAAQALTELAQLVSITEAEPALLRVKPAPQVRQDEGGAHAPAPAVDEAGVRDTLQHLRGADAADRQALLLRVGPALGKLEATHALSPQTRELAMETLGTLASAEDQELAARAIDALRWFAAKEAAGIVAKLMRSPSLRKRARATFALSAFDGDETRKLLRYLLMRPTPRLATAAVLALGEVGDQRDAAAIVRKAVRLAWPVNGAAAFALARMAARGVIKKRTLGRTLCEFAASREPYVRANVAAAMASMAAPACNESVHPLRWLDATHASALRVAAARWARAAAEAGELSAAEVEPALRHCAGDADPAVAKACSRQTVVGKREQSDVYAYQNDGQQLLRNRLVALRFVDGTVFLGYSDDNGHVMLRAAATGERILEDPAQTPLEP